MSAETDDQEDHRIELTRQNGDLTVTIKSQKHVFISLFMCMWLLIWGPGLYIIYIALLSGKDFIFVVLWLVFWVAIGAALMCFVMWNFFGREVIEIRQNRMIICRKIPGWSRKRSYELDRVGKLRVNDSLERQLYTNQVPPPNIFSGWSQGAIRFNYNKRNIGFGMELEHFEASELVRVLCMNYPEFN